MEAKADKSHLLNLKLHSIAKVRKNEHENDRDYKPLEHLDGADPAVGKDGGVLYTDLPWGVCLGMDEDSLPKFDNKQDKIYACHIKSRDHKITFVFIADPKHPKYPHVFLTDGGITVDKTSRGGLKILAPMGWHSFALMQTMMDTTQEKENLDTMLKMARKGYNDFAAASLKNSVDSDSTVAKSTDSVNVTKAYIGKMRELHRIVGLRSFNNDLIYVFNAPTEKDVLPALGESGKRAVRSEIGASALRILGHAEEEIALRGVTDDKEKYRKQLGQAYNRWAEEQVFSVGLAQLNIDNDFHPVAKVLNDAGDAFDPGVERMLREYGTMVVENTGKDTGFSVDSFLEKSLNFYKGLYEDSKDTFTNIGGAKGCIPLTILIDDTNGMTSERSEGKNPILSRFFLEEFNRVTDARNATFDRTWLNTQKSQDFHTKLSGISADLTSQNYNRLSAFMKKKAERFAKEHTEKYHDTTATMQHFYNIMKAYNFAYSKFDVTDEKTHGYFDRQERASDIIVAREKQGGGKMLVGINSPTDIFNKRVEEFFISKTNMEPPAFQSHYTLGSFARMLETKMGSSHVRFVTPEGKVEDMEFEVLARAANDFINKPTEELRKKYGFSKQYVDEVGYTSFAKQKTDKELSELRIALSKTLGENTGRFYGAGKPVNPYLKAQAEMKTAVSSLFGRLLPDANNNALMHLGVFTIRDKTTARKESFVFSRGREDQAGQLYKIVDNEYVIPIPATIQTDDSPYLQVMKILKNYATNNSSPGYQLYLPNEMSDLHKAEIKKWAESTEQALNELRHNTFLSEHLSALSAYAQMTDSMSSLAIQDKTPPESIFKYDTFTIGHRTFSTVPKGPRAEEMKSHQMAAYTIAKDNWDQVKKYVKLQMELHNLRNEEIRKTLPHASPELISVLTTNIESEQQQILANLAEMAPKMREAQHKFDNFVFSLPSSGKLVDHFDRLTAMHDEYVEKPGFFQQMVVDFANVIDSAFNGFGKTIGAVVKALLNPAYAMANMVDAAETALYSAVKTFFTVLFSGFVDRQFGDPRLKWMHAGAKQAMGGFNMKYMSEGDMRQFHQTIAFDTKDKTPEAISRDRVLTAKLQAKSDDLHEVIQDRDTYNRFIRVFSNPTLEAAPEERSHSGPRRNGILFRWDIQDPELALRHFGLDVNAALSDPYVLERWWRTEHKGGIVPHYMLIPTNLQDITPTGGGVNYATVKNRNVLAMKLNKNLKNNVYLSDSGRSLYIKADLTDFGLTPQDIYGNMKTTASDKTKIAMMDRENFNQKFNQGDTSPFNESNRPIHRYRLAFD